MKLSAPPPQGSDTSGRGHRTGLSRRTVLVAAGASVVAGAAGASVVVAGQSNADGTGTVQDSPTPHTGPLPNSGGHVPLIGLGTFMTFDRRPGTDQSFIPTVLREFFDGGGRVVDTSALYGASEANVGHFARELGITDDIFPPLPDDDQRARMLSHLQEMPEFARIAALPWYPGKSFTDGLVRLPQPHPAG